MKMSTDEQNSQSHWTEVKIELVVHVLTAGRAGIIAQWFHFLFIYVVWQKYMILFGNKWNWNERYNKEFQWYT